jgi:AcrR family transcriptional regulator
MADVKRSRREKAAQTRARIIEAAHAEFLDRGFHGATIASVATRAGVATQTVYFVFHTKAELISAVIDAQVMAPDPATGEVRPPELMPWWQEMVTDPDPVSTLVRFVRGVAPLYERAAAVSEVLRAAALTDDEVRRTHEHHMRLQREGFGGVVRLVAEKGTLRDGLDEARATDVLLTVFGDSTYHLLRTEHGWSHETVLAWFEAVLPDLLLRTTG